MCVWRGGGGDTIAMMSPTWRHHHNKCPLTYSIISCSNTVSERLHRSVQNIFPPILNSLSTGQTFLGLPSTWLPVLLDVNTFVCWEAQKVNGSFCLSSTGCYRYSWIFSCTGGGATAWEAVGFGACPGTLCPSWSFLVAVHCCRLLQLTKLLL